MLFLQSQGAHNLLQHMVTNDRNIVTNHCFAKHCNSYITVTLAVYIFNTYLVGRYYLRNHSSPARNINLYNVTQVKSTFLLIV